MRRTANKVRPSIAASTMSQAGRPRAPAAGGPRPVFGRRGSDVPVVVLVATAVAVLVATAVAVSRATAVFVLRATAVSVSRATAVSVSRATAVAVSRAT